MKIGVYQNNPEFGKKEKNLQQAIEKLDNIDGDLIVLPEFFNTGYQFISKTELENLAEEVPGGATCEALLDVARSKDLFLVFGIAEKENGKFYNSAAVVGPHGFIGKYRKSHLFGDEKFFFEPGDTGFRVFDIGSARLGVMICFDWWFPESARCLALMEADIICHPANLVLKDCQRTMKIRSLENAVYSATANRIGGEARGGKPALEFTGESQITSPSGEILTRLGRDDTGISVVDVDIAKARDKSIAMGNDRFRDRRPGMYRVLTDSQGRQT
jgi:predicted amidohydrolase